MPYTYRKRLPSDNLPGWDRTDGFVIVQPNGQLADWPIIESERVARRYARQFNRYDDTAANEALNVRRMAGDLEG